MRILMEVIPYSALAVDIFSDSKKEKQMNAQPSMTSIDLATGTFPQLAPHFDLRHQTAWCYMRASRRPCFTTALLDDLKGWCSLIERQAEQLDLKYHVIASATPGVFNLGGDLELFREHVSRGDRRGLLDYALACIDPLYANIRRFHQGLTTISLVQGEALGGGLETALSSDVLIVERQARLGFPEVLFNLFPGMGAYQLLARKLGPHQAERLILSGRVYTAEELFDMGLVEVLAEEGEGEAAVYDYIKRENRSRNGYRALRQVRDAANPITYEALREAVEIWVDAALRLEQRDLRMMGRLVRRQYQQSLAAA